MAEQPKSKRRKTRFAPEIFTSAELTLAGGERVTALVLDESFQGARLLLPKLATLASGDKVTAKVGELDAAQAVVRWADRWDKQRLVAVGIEYLDL
jgi:hypothetical protein